MNKKHRPSKKRRLKHGKQRSPRARKEIRRRNRIAHHAAWWGRLTRAMAEPFLERAFVDSLFPRALYRVTTPTADETGVYTVLPEDESAVLSPG